MRCSACGRDNRAGLRFCTGCGSGIAPRCEACGATAEPGARACGECGAPLVQPCPRCGGDPEPGDAFCGECGWALAEAAAPAVRPAPPALPADRPENASEVRARLEEIAPRVESAAPEEEASRANPLDALVEDVFVGRERELDRLRGALEAALGGTARLCVVSGEAGLGKTRLAAELAARASARGVLVAWGHCGAAGGEPGYGPWLEIVRALLDEGEGEALLRELGPAARDVAELVPELRRALPDPTPPPPLPAPEARHRFCDAVIALLRAALGRRPLCLVLDGLECAEEPTRELLALASGALAAERLLVVCTARGSGELPASPSLATEPIALGGLSAEEVGRLLAETAKVDAPPHLVEALHRKSGGSPFLATELVRLLAWEGRLGGRELPAPLPGGAGELIARRMEHLSEECSELLAIASVVGQGFDVAVLRQVLDLAEDPLRELLAEGVAARLVVESEAGRYRFADPLVGEVLYDDLGDRLRERIHARVAQALEAGAGGDAGRLRLIAHHRVRAGETGSPERIVPACLAAAAEARAGLAFERAALLQRQAVEAHERSEGTDRGRLGELLADLAECERDAGRPERAGEAGERAADLAGECGDWRTFARAALACGAPALLEEALGQLEPDDGPLRVRLLDALADERHAAGDGARSRELDVAAMELSCRLAEPAALAVALDGAAARGWLDDADTWLRAADAAERLGEPSLLRRAHGLCAHARLVRGERAAADRALDAEARLAEELRGPRERWLRASHGAMRALLEGRFAAVAPLAREARERAPARGAARWSLAQEALARLQCGGEPDPEPGSPGPGGDRVVAAMLSLLDLAAGRPEAGRDRLEAHGAWELEALPRDAEWPALACGVAEVCARLDDAERAAVLYARLLPLRERHAVAGSAQLYCGTFAHRLALLAASLGRQDEAERHFAEAQRREEAMAAAPWLAQVRADFAQLLLERRQAGDLERASGLIEAALASAQELGMGRLAERLAALGRALREEESRESAEPVVRIAASVAKRRPDLGRHAARDGTVTLLFGEVGRFVAPAEEIAAEEVPGEHGRIVREHADLHEGRVVELQREGFLLAFQSARSAILCAIDLQRAFDEHSVAHPDQPLHVQVGLHRGEAVDDADRFFRATVLEAARIAGQAAEGEILVSAPLRSLLDVSGDLRFAEPREVELRGLAGRHELVPVIWAKPASAR